MPKKKKLTSRSVKTKVKKNIAKQKITKNMNISSVINKYPQTANVFMVHGMYCFGCAIAQDETIEQGAKAHGNINLPKLVNNLNLAAEKKLNEVEEKIIKVEEKIGESKIKISFFKRLFKRK